MTTHRTVALGVGAWLLVLILAPATALAGGPLVGFRAGNGMEEFIVPDEEFEVEIRVTNSTGVDTLNWAIALQHDPTRLELLSVVSGDFSDVQPVPGIIPSFSEVTTIDNGSGTGLIVAQFVSPDGSSFIPAAVEPVVAIATYRNLMTVEGDQTTLEFVDGVLANSPSPPVTVAVGTTDFATFEGASAVGFDNLLLTTTLGPRFFRGGCEPNSDGPSLADLIFLLNFIFSAGAAPDCEDACDANDDGILGFSDAIDLIGFLFSGTPPPDFGTCVNDLPNDDDDLECLIEPDACL